MSTIGGGTPPGQRWLGRELQRHLRFPDRRRVGSSQRLEVARTAAEGRLDEAVEGYGRLTARRPGDASAWFGLAEALRAAGEPRRAGFAYHRAAELEPLLEHGDLFVADGLWLNGGYAPALDRYRSYLAARPASPFRAYALRRIGGCLMRLGRDEDAIDVFRQVVELAPDHADTRLDLGLLLRRGGRVAEALEQLQEARRILPHRGRYALALGTTYLMHGMPGRGARELEQAVRHQPCLARARANLSVALEQLGRPRDAARHLRLALALQPENPELVTLADQLEVRGVRLVRNP